MTTEIMLKIVRTGKPGVPQFMESQGIGQDLVTEFYGHLYLAFKVLLPIKLDMIMNQHDLLCLHLVIFATPWTVACQAPVHGDSPGKNTSG